MYKRQVPSISDNCCQLFKERVILEDGINILLRKTADAAYPLGNIPNDMLNNYNELVGEDANKISNALEHLHDTTNICEIDGDINLKFYAKKLYNYFYHYKLKRDWTDLAQSDDSDFLLKGACIVAMWCSPYDKVSIQSVTSQIDDIVNEIKQSYEEIQGPTNDFSQRPLKAVDHINHILYDVMKFRGNNRAYYDINNSFIHKVCVFFLYRCVYVSGFTYLYTFLYLYVWKPGVVALHL